MHNKDSRNQDTCQPDYGDFRCQGCGNDIRLGQYPRPACCPWCGLTTSRNVHPNYCRAAAVIRHYGRKPIVNRVLANWYQSAIETWQHHWAGRSQRAIAAKQGLSKTAVCNRLLTSISLYRSELRRLTAWLTPAVSVVNIDGIGIDHQPEPQDTTRLVRTWRPFVNRYGYVMAPGIKPFRRRHQ